MTCMPVTSRQQVHTQDNTRQPMQSQLRTIIAATDITSNISATKWITIERRQSCRCLAARNTCTCQMSTTRKAIHKPKKELTTSDASKGMWRKMDPHAFALLPRHANCLSGCSLQQVSWSLLLIRPCAVQTHDALSVHVSCCVFLEAPRS